MSLPNVAVAFPAENLTAILDGIEALKPHFPVLTQVGPDDRRGLQTIAEGREPYVAEAFTDAQGSPGTVPGTLKMADWTLVEAHYDALDVIESRLVGLLELVRGLKAVAGSVRYENVRRYYDYLAGNLDVLPGAQSIYSKIGRLFAKQGNRAKATAGGAIGNG